jgi:choline dehydrogenase
LTNNAGDFLAWEKIPSALRAAFSKQTNETLAKYPADWPEIEVCRTADHLACWSNTKSQIIPGPSYLGNFSGTIDQPNDGFQYASLLLFLVAPSSRGTVTISSADTSDLPVINPAFLTSKADQDIAVAAFKRARMIAAAYSMKPVMIGGEYSPGKAVSTDAQILDWIQTNLAPAWHASSTCAMGKVQDPNAVVDSSAKVIGVKNVRVVDASAFPFLPPGHPQSTVCEYGELAKTKLMPSRCSR